MSRELPHLSEPAGHSPPPIQGVEAARDFDAHAAQVWVRRMAQRPHAWLHAEVARRMADKLAFFKAPPQTVLEWWGGFGASASALDAALPLATRALFEPSDAWARRSQRERRPPWWRLAHWGQDAPKLIREHELLGSNGKADTFDMVWANMVLPYVADPPSLFAQWERRLSPGGFLMFSCLGPDTLRELSDIYRTRGWGAASTHFIDMHDLGDMMVQAGLSEPVMDQERITLTWSTPADLLADLRAWGRNTAASRFPGLRGRAWQRRLSAELQALADAPGAEGRMALTVELIYGHAFKASSRRAGPGETQVGIDEMRALMRKARRRA